MESPYIGFDYSIALSVLPYSFTLKLTSIEKEEAIFTDLRQELSISDELHTIRPLRLLKLFILA